MRARTQGRQTPGETAHFEDFDLHMAHAPVIHFAQAWNVKIDRVGADQRRPIVIDTINAAIFHHPKKRSGRKTRPIGGCAVNLSATQAASDAVGAIPVFLMTVSGRPNDA